MVAFQMGIATRLFSGNVLLKNSRFSVTLATDIPIMRKQFITKDDRGQRTPPFLWYSELRDNWLRFLVFGSEDLLPYKPRYLRPNHHPRITCNLSFFNLSTSGFVFRAVLGFFAHWQEIQIHASDRREQWYCNNNRVFHEFENTTVHDLPNRAYWILFDSRWHEKTSKTSHLNYVLGLGLWMVKITSHERK